MHDLKRPLFRSALPAALLGLLIAACAPSASGPAAPAASPAATTAPAASPAPGAAPAPAPSPAPGAALSPAPSPAPGATTAPAAAAPAASPLASPAAAAAPSPPAGQASPGPAAIERYRTLLAASSAYAQGDLATALRLYRTAAEDTAPLPSTLPERSAAEQQLRAYARFRYLVASVVAGQEDEARAALEQARVEDAATPFLGLGLAFWDTYGQTADPAVACRRVNELVAEEPAAVVRSLGSFSQASPAIRPERVCELPGS
jgi:hypothetical protein